MNLSNLGVAGIPTGPLSRCPCCFSGSLHINADFCFGLCHFARCGTASVKLQPPNSQLFLQGKGTSQLVQQASTPSGAAAAAQAEADRACSDFNAASVMARTSEKCDVTAVGSTMCRHAIVAHLMDISTGERYIYAAVMLYTLMVCHARLVAVVWYDINCKFGRWFLRWAAAVDALCTLVERAAVRFPLPCFHRYSHSASCQERNANVHMPGTALQYHEPNETLWAKLAAHGTTTQYMTHRNRWGRLERGAQLHNEEQADRIVPRLLAMLAAATRTRDQAASAVDGILKQLFDSHGLSKEQATDLVLRRDEAIEAHADQDLKPPPLAEYARLRLCSAYLGTQRCTGASLPSAVDVFTGSAESLPQRDAAALGRHDARLRALARQVFPGGDPALDGAAFAGAVAALAAFEISRHQTWLQRSAQQVQLMEGLIILLTGRPGEQSKTRSSRQRLQARMQGTLNSLCRWLSGGYVGFELFPAEVRACSASLTNSRLWTVAAICHGAYPWEASAATAEPATAVGAAAATREQLVTRLRTQANEMRRAEEELALLAEELVRCIHYLNVRHAEIGAALVRCQERSAAGLAGSPVPPCSSFGASQPETEAERSRELQYCEGLELLLRHALQKATAQLTAASAAFGDSGGNGSNAFAEDDYECCDDEDEVI
ncbi:Tcr1 transposon ORF2 [Micractinium conductrix]|uniref:Tcr1 transposon ORF2 n=1 Tax=Micractinium conductrix TaxID=554055 RepID=A0A2P6VD22_9CHLO|nr:Tcr1 transposon ORF2 [Micractinium conductrix]|eukprot:PSC71951.1 Tcr1 transposon ORF2 [Micractinium conductrix]